MRLLVKRYLDFKGRAYDLLYTLVMRRCFALWGVGSRLGRNAKLNEPKLICVGSSVVIV